MASLRDIRNRIGSVQNTQQVTRAMKMVAAAKLRRAQENIFRTRPYAYKLGELIARLKGQVDPALHPLFQHREETRGVLLVVITADRGLAGSFNANVVKGANNFIAKDNPASAVALGLVGRKGREHFVRRGFDVRHEAVNIFQKVQYEDARKIAEAAMDEFTNGRVSSVYLVYNEFKSIISQRVVIERLLPIPKLEIEPGTQQADYLFEPGPEQILGSLLPRHVETQVWRALLESAAAEHAARMTAMDAATRNSSEILDSLTLYMNKVRQAAITREIIEVVSGAEAL